MCGKGSLSVTFAEADGSASLELFELLVEKREAVVSAAVTNLRNICFVLNQLFANHFNPEFIQYLEKCLLHFFAEKP
jgi:hypothetical protein